MQLSSLSSHHIKTDLHHWEDTWCILSLEHFIEKNSRDLQNEDMKFFQVCWTLEELVICKMIHSWKGNISHCWKQFSEQGDCRGVQAGFVIQWLRALFECYVNLTRLGESSLCFFYNICPSFNLTCESLKAWKGTFFRSLVICSGHEWQEDSIVQDTSDCLSWWKSVITHWTDVHACLCSDDVSDMIEAESVVVYWVLITTKTLTFIFQLIIQLWAFMKYVS